MSYLRYLCLFTYSAVENILCCVFILFFCRIVDHMLPVSLQCHFFIAPSVFSNVYRIFYSITKTRKLVPSGLYVYLFSTWIENMLKLVWYIVYKIFLEQLFHIIQVLWFPKQYIINAYTLTALKMVIESVPLCNLSI